MPKLSVIIPVYNSEKYLTKCLDSVLNQTLNDLEVICIDDGSTDNSIPILKKYAEQDSRIKIFSEQHSGPANARNLGIEHASADTITFLDADDWIYDKDSYKQLYNDFIENNLDILAFEHYEYNHQTEKIIPDESRQFRFFFEEKEKERVLKKAEFSKYIFRFSPFPWDKFYKRDLLIKNDIKFPANLAAGEDAAFGIFTMLYAEKIKFSKSKIIVYRTNLNTSLTSAKIHTCLNFPVEVCKSVYSFLYERNLYSANRTEFIISSINRLLRHYLSYMNNKAEYNAYTSIVKDYLKTLSLDDNTLKQISKIDSNAVELLHEHLDYPLHVTYKLFSIIPVLNVLHTNNSAAYYFLGIPVCKKVRKGKHAADIYLFGKIIKLIKSVTY